MTSVHPPSSPLYWYSLLACLSNFSGLDGINAVAVRIAHSSRQDYLLLAFHLLFIEVNTVNEGVNEEVLVVDIPVLSHSGSLQLTNRSPNHQPHGLHQ